MAKVTLVLDDGLLKNATAEANRAHKGDLSAVASAALSFYLHVQAGLRRVEEATSRTEAPPAAAPPENAGSAQFHAAAVRNVFVGKSQGAPGRTQIADPAAVRRLVRDAANQEQLLAAGLAADGTFSGKDLSDFAQRLLRVAERMNAGKRG